MDVIEIMIALSFIIMIVWGISGIGDKDDKNNNRR